MNNLNALSKLASKFESVIKKASDEIDMKLAFLKNVLMKISNSSVPVPYKEKARLLASYKPTMDWLVSAQLEGRMNQEQQKEYYVVAPLFNRILLVREDV